jgi:hypothetical protein
MCTPWKASASKKAVQAAHTGPAQPFFRNVECGLGWGSAVPTLGHIRDDMSGPSNGHLALRNSHAITEVFLGNGMGLTLVLRLLYFFHIQQFALLTLRT